jgi:hypothetical protein
VLAKSLKDMVVCAVRYKLVSDCNSLIMGRFTGNFS